MRRVTGTEAMSNSGRALAGNHSINCYGRHDVRLLCMHDVV